MSDADWLSALKGLFPADRLLLQPAQLIPYESDALTAYRARPAAVVIPETGDEVVAAVRVCARYGVPFVARGSGTSLSGGSLPIEDGLLIALNRLNRVLRLDPADRIAVVEPGIANLDVTKAAAPFGLYYAPDPSSQPISTIGGNLAFNAGGAHCLKYGMTSNHVLGIKAVLPDGEVVHLGGESLEGVGPDLTGLFVGSEGLFGIALEVTLRLMPKPEKFRTVLAAYHSLETAGNAVASVVASGLLPGAMEIMDRLAIQAAEAAVQAGYPLDAAALLIVELDGEAQQVDEEFPRLMAVMEASGAYEVRVARDEAERLRIWKGRKSAFSAVGRLSPDYIVNDGVVPRGRLGEALREIERLSAAYGLRVANVFHAGDGNLHPLIMYQAHEPDGFERAEALAGEILDLCIRLGGSITGEHGVGVEKRAYLSRMFAEADLDAMRRLRHAIDPQEIANRGKMFPPKGPLGAGDGPAAPRHTGPHPLERAGVISRE
jgi:glycolate oxidase